VFMECLSPDVPDFRLSMRLACNRYASTGTPRRSYSPYVGTWTVMAETDLQACLCHCRREHMVAVRQRPHLAAFLERVAQLFEVVIFTASQKVRSFATTQHLHY